MITLDDILADLTPRLKVLGYKKRKLVWHKRKEGLSVVFGIQKSQYASDVWYYQLGICLEELASGGVSLGQCQITYRMDHITDNVLVTADMLVRILNSWEERYGEMGKLRLCAVQGQLPLLTTQQARSYLTIWGYKP